ncbi:MAG TPA: carboxypeptidase regulatory-like domain-containing protein [Blastocatellia bacterium]|nr:carboxypeptidase regulatory-like domain-containing protein [Blastocatellia bacterium]
MISLAFAVCALCAPSYLSAGSIRSVDDLDHVNFEGVVADSSGNVIAEARVFVRQPGVGAERSAKTNLEGRYRFTTLSPGVYELRAEADGFQTARHERINAIAGATTRQDFKLSPAAIEAQITVNAAANPTLVDTARTVVGGTVTKEQIDKLPTESRNPLDLIFTLPGVAPPALSVRDLAEGDVKDDFRSTPEESGVFSLTGGAPFSNNITIEGLDNNDDRGARERINLSIHAVEEVQVITNQFSAEYGRASGGRVNLRLRGGSNELHGQAFYYFRDESLNANSYARNADAARGFRTPFQNHNPGASAGGPLIKNKIFLFGAYEYDNVYDRAEIVALTPVDANPAVPLPRPNGADLGATARNRNGQTATVNGGASVGLYDETVTTPRVAHTLQSRVDFKLGEKHDASTFFTLARNRDERGFPGGRRTLDTLLSSGRNSQSYAFSDNIILSPRMVNTARFQFSRLAPVFAPPADKPVVIIDIDDPRDVIGDANANPLTRSGNLVAGASTLAGVDRREDRYQLQDTLNYTRGPHTARIGLDAQIIRSRFVDLSDTTGTFDFDTVADFLANTPSRYRHRFNTDSELRNTYTGVFFQDDWKPKQNLTFSFGLRWENETVIEDRNNLGPRLSMAWDPFKTGKTAVRAGYGIFYNRALLRTLDDFILTSKAIRIDTNNEAAERLLTELRFPAVLAANDPRVPELGVRESGFLRRLSDDFRIPESYQASLGFEREVTGGFKVEVNYIFNRGLHLWREINANAPRLPAGFSNFTEYLLSRDFDNSRNPATGQRPITATGNADVVRFNLSQTPSQTITEGGRGGRRVVIIGLNNPSTANNSIGRAGALAALRNLRPDPSVTQVEELQSRGNSYYHGISFEAQRRLTKRGFLRASYTLSKLIDDGVVNTSSPLVVGDFHRERSLSLQDARRRMAISGNYLFPAWFARLNLSGTFNYSSSSPFSIGVGGADRNLDDVNNDRPNFTGDLGRIVWRRPGEPLDPALASAFSLPTIGSSGNLPRDAGRGPSVYTLNLRLAREFAFSERSKAELQIEAFNPLNATVFNFGSEFIDFGAAGLGDFLTPRRTVKPRTLRVGLKFDF